ncbi:MAG: chorismate lyase [Pseudohongiellaceae bacterium]
MIDTHPDIADSTHNWLPLSQSSLDPSNPLWHWIADAGSLTKRLKQKSNSQFTVELVEENWCENLPQNLRVLFGPVNNPHRFWSRKVTLVGQGVPWVKAHTLIPEHSFESPLREVFSLNVKPLGEYLFNQPNLIRTEMDVTVDDSDTWGRRSLFYLFGKPVLVAEFFLEDLIGTSS